MNPIELQATILLCQAIDHRQFGRLSEADGCLDRLLELDPTHVPALNEKGRTCMARGQVDEAIHHFELGLERAPKDPYALNSLGVAYRHQGEIDKAFECFERGLAVNPTNTHILSELALTHQQRGDTTEAAHYFTESQRNRNLGNDISGLVKHLQTCTTPGVVIAGLAHEVNNILEEIHLSLKSIRREVSESQPAPYLVLENIADVTSCAHRIHRLLGHFNKRAHRKEVGLDTVPIQQLIEFAFDLLGDRLRACQISWEIVTQPSDLPPISCNQLEMEQLFLNLVSNSIDAFSESQTEDPRILVKVTEDSSVGEIEIRFSDNGPGIPSSIARRIFDFSFSTKDDGRGVGLWLCQFDVESAGGRIELESESGDGASFLICLPTTEESDD